MSHPLEHKLAQLRRRLRRAMIARGASRLLAAVVGTAIALGAVDYVFRFQDPGMRVMLAAVFWVAVGGAAYRWAYRPATVPIGRLELARRLGRRFPELGDDLPSAIEFLGQTEDDPVAGSAELRRAVIAETEAKADRVDFTSLVDRRPVVRGAMLAVGACLVAAILLALDTLSCQVAVARLVWPLGDVAWPRKHHLQLVDRIERVARGRPFEIEVIDRDGRLPERADVQYRLKDAGGEWIEETQPMRRVGSTMVARRENVARSFAYRVEGGDDRSMPWIEVAMVEPPAVASFVATITPPEYTGWPVSRSTGSLRVLRGSRIEIDATATKPLESAALRLEDDGVFPCQVDRDGHRFTLGHGESDVFQPKKSGFYGFELVDREGIRGGAGDRWELRVIDDEPPSVVVERPSGTTFVTPEATLPIRVAARDDLALRRVSLVMESSADRKSHSENGDRRLTTTVSGSAAHVEFGASPRFRSGSQSADRLTIVLYEGPPRAAPTTDAAGGQRQAIDYRWSLVALQLKPGEQFSFRVVAEDYCSQSVASDARAIVVVRPEQLIDRLAGRQQAILAELGRALNLEQESRRQVDGLRGELKLDQSGVDRLRSAELAQREVGRILTSRTDGVPGEVVSLLGDLADNRLDSPDVQRRMDGLLQELGRLGRDVLPTIAREMTASIKGAEIRLDSVCRSQDEVISTLETLVGRLGQWNDYRRFHRRWAELLAREESLAERTAALGRDLLGKLPEDILPEAAARLDAASGEQIELARRLDQLLQEMDASRAALEAKDPLAAAILSEAAARSRELEIGSRMRAAGEAVARNRLEHAKSLEAMIIIDLREVLELLANRREDELARLADRLPESKDRLSELIRRQKDLRERMEQESSSGVGGDVQRWEWQSLGRQQAALKTAAEQFAARLAQLLAERPAEAVRTAAEQMNQASRSAAATDASSAVRHAMDAEKSLAEAAVRLSRHLEKIKSDAAAEQLARLVDTIRSLQERQQKTAEATKRADDAGRAGGGEAAARAFAVRRLAAEQQGLREETVKLAADLADAGVFRRVLDAAAERMGVAAGWLGRRTTDARAQTAQQAALERLTQLAEALRQEAEADEPSPEAAGQDTAAGGQEGKNRPSPGAVAQLRLLKMLQEDLFTRTQAWEKRFGGVAPLPPEAEREYKRLSEEQGALAELLFDLIGSGSEDVRADGEVPNNQP